MTGPVPDPAGLQDPAGGPYGPDPAQMAGPQQPADPNAPDAETVDGVDLVQLEKAIDAGTNLGAATSTPDDYLKFAQGVKMLADALLALQAGPGALLPPPPSGGNAPASSGSQGA